jgi:hypothetical protein
MFFKRRYWGGYHFPRHWNLFNKKSITKLAEKTHFEVAYSGTQVSPVNWVYTIHNWLVSRRAPKWLINRFYTQIDSVSVYFYYARYSFPDIGSGCSFTGDFKKAFQLIKSFK